MVFQGSKASIQKFKIGEPVQGDQKPPELEKLGTQILERSINFEMKDFEIKNSKSEKLKLIRNEKVRADLAVTHKLRTNPKRLKTQKSAYMTKSKSKNRKPLNTTLCPLSHSSNSSHT